MRRFLFFVLTAILLLQITSCSPERRLANVFIKQPGPVAILLLAPDFSYKYNYKIPDIDNFDSLPVNVQDSLLFYNSRLLQYIEDSIFFSNYLIGLSSGLKSSGMNPYFSDSAENFLSAQSEALILNLAQLQFEEYYDSIGDEASFGDIELYSYELFITAVNVSSWFELSMINNHDTSAVVLFTSNTLTDNFTGGFQYLPFSGEVKYNYTIDSITTDFIYSSAYTLGNIYSGYLYDYLMNEYIQKNLPPDYVAKNQYTYDRYTGMIKKNKKGQGFSKLR
ncbi:MAG: hypothetical protein HGA37_11020 [Lentimicrobium sp.]|nr:hypothetical protein [Lentimicrobium sp.]